MPVFTHEGIRFHYQERGSGQPFVFQHGLGASVDQPFSLFQPPPGFRLLAFDARDHGRTEPPVTPDHLGFQFFSGDLLAFLQHVQVDQAIVGGISMGAGIALQFTVSHPERVRGLVLSRPAWFHGPCPWNVHMFSLITRLLREHGARRGQEVFKQTPEYQDTLARWPDVAQSLALQFESPQVEQTALKYERIVHDCPACDPQAWAKITVPTLVLGNRQDPVHPFEYAEGLAQAIPNAAFHEITPKSVSVDQHGADVQRALTQFLTHHFT